MKFDRLHHAVGLADHLNDINALIKIMHECNSQPTAKSGGDMLLRPPRNYESSIERAVRFVDQRRAAVGMLSLLVDAKDEVEKELVALGVEVQIVRSKA